MQRYIIRRLILAVIIVWFISVAVFILLRVSPGDPALLQQGISATPETVKAYDHAQGFDRPMIVQYFDWMGKLAHGDLGRSLLTQTSVSTEFRNRLPVSFELMVLTLIWVVIFGIPFGIISAVKQNSIADNVIRLVATIALAVPAFWVATLVLIIPLHYWNYAPPLGGKPISLFSNPGDNLRQFLPASLVLGFASIASIMRLTRSSMLEVLRQDFVRTARAKGLRERVVIYRHALRNSLIPAITLLGLLAAGLLGGAVIIEQVFDLPGLGAYLYTSILQKDFYVVQSLVMYTALATVLLNLAVDVFYAVLDPRIRY